MSIIELIKLRTSWRNYASSKLKPEVLEQIQNYLSQEFIGPFGNQSKFFLIENDQKEEKIKLGTYGFIKNAPYFIVGKIRPDRNSFFDYGYLLEKIILFLTEMDLGTCWLGGTFKREQISWQIPMNSDELIPAITPAGYKAGSRSIRDSVIRLAAGSKKRKEWGKLFFENDFKSELKPDNQNYHTMLEMVRIAPSASNKQPWRIVHAGSCYYFFLCRTKNYQKVFKSIDIQEIDLGIAMYHFEAAARELDQNGRWKRNLSLKKLRDDWEYIISWDDSSNSKNGQK